MGIEEQKEEREVLESIFPDEITEISETEFRIAITLDLPDDNTGAEPPSFQLHVRYPEAYPDVAPNLDLDPPAGGSGGRHPHFSLAEDRAAVLAALEAPVEESLGMAMVFTLVTSAQEAAESLIAERRAADAAREEEAALAAEREENKKFHGEVVSPASFLRWREGFLREMAEREAREEEEALAADSKKGGGGGGAGKRPEGKLTGRQLWERGLAGKGGEEDEDDGAGVADDVAKLKVTA